MLCHTKWTAVVAVCCLAMPAIALAQRQPTRAFSNQPAQQNQAAPGGAMENHDAFLADWLIIDNNTEIEMAKLALQKAASDEVKQFARR